MDENEVVVLDLQLDSADAEKTLERLLEDADALGKMFKDIGAEMSKLFGTLQKSLEKTAANVELMTQALGKATEAVEKLLQSFSAEGMTEGLSAAGEQVLGLFGDIAGGIAGAIAGLVIEGYLTSGTAAMGTVLKTIGIQGAIFTAIAVAAIAAITLLIANWDKISSAVQTFVTETLPQAWGQLTQWFQNVATAITGFFTSCWDQLVSFYRDLAQWIREQVIVPICNAWNTVCKAVEIAFAIVKECLAQACSWIYANVVAPLGGLLCGVWDGLVSGAKAAWEAVKSVFGRVADFFSEVFCTAWQSIVKVFSVAGEIFTDIKDGIFEAFKWIVNSLIKGINAVVKIPFDAINSALQTVRDVKIFDITPFSGLRTISVPQIPYLAKGAVLPANKPFLAMVGDQRHGTNVEAPLSTIQEAVAVVLDEQLGAVMAGFNATVQEIRALREAVGNIRVGDEAIWRAAERYREKRAVMRGTW